MNDDVETTPVDLTDPASRSGVLQAALSHVSFSITDALVWLPARGPCSDKDVARARNILDGARQYIATTLARLDGKHGHG